MRIFFFGISVAYLVSSPMILLVMSPEYDFYSFYSVPLILYSIITSVIFLFLFIDMIRYGPFVLLKLAGLDVNDANANEIARDIQNNKHFLKLRRKK